MNTPDTPELNQPAPIRSSDLLHRVTTEEVKELLRKVGNGELIPKLKEPEWPWEKVYAGNVIYDVGGWHVEIFNDCDSWDYVDSVKSPDGREGEFEDWFGPEDKDGQREWRQPDDLLSIEDSGCYNRMRDAFTRAV